MQFEKTAASSRLRNTDRFSFSTEDDCESSLFNKDSAAAVRWLESCRDAGEAAHDRENRPIRNSGTRSLNESLDAASIKSAVIWIEGDQSLAAFNAKAREWLGVESSMLGHRFAFKLSRMASRLSDLSDQMLRLGTSTVQYEFEGAMYAGNCHRWAIRKTRLPGILTTGTGCLWIARSLASVTSGEFSSLEVLEEQLSRFESLDEIDRKICQGMTLGDTTSEIASSVKLTRRSVEVRRAKILEYFGFTRKVQIVRMMVRFEENGCFGT